jgi:hypothetical protein
MTSYRANDQNDLNKVLDDDKITDDMKLEVSGFKLSAATAGELRRSQNLPFPLIVETPRIIYPETTLKIRRAD